MKPSIETCEKIDKFIAYLREEPKRNNMHYWGLAAAPGVDLKEVKNKIKGFGEQTEYWDNHEGHTQLREIEQILEANPPCNTIHCAAGAMCLVAGLIKPEFDVENKQIFYDFGPDTPDMARKWLGISREDADHLFYLVDWGYGSGWPKEFEDELNKFKPGTPEYTEVVVSRFVHYKETGE